MARILAPTNSSIKEAATQIKKGELVAFPTETVYGLGADATNENAVNKIYAAKRRPSNNPLIVHVASHTEISKLVSKLSSAQERFLESLKPLWPGPLSVVLPASDYICSSARAGKSSVAVRIPNHPVALQLITLSGRPIAAPSANPSGYVSPTTAMHVADQLANEVSLILDGGPCEVGVESTILSILDSNLRLLRPGGTTIEELESRLGQKIITNYDGTDIIAPGMLKEHYAPKAKLIISTTPLSETPPIGSALLVCGARKIHSAEQFSSVVELSPSGDLTEVAKKLYSALRELDERNVPLIVVEPCERSGLGIAVLDRILRAAAKYSK